MVGQLLLGQLGAGLQPVFDNGAGQRLDDASWWPRIPWGMIAVHSQKCIHFGRLKHVPLACNVLLFSTDTRTWDLSTHVLDTMHGCPAGGMAVHAVHHSNGDSATLVQQFNLNPTGATPTAPAVRQHQPCAGQYRLVFDVAGYFQAPKGVQLPEPSFLDRVSLDFGVAHTDQHYHVPLLVSPGAIRPTAAPEAAVGAPAVYGFHMFIRLANKIGSRPTSISPTMSQVTNTVRFVLDGRSSKPKASAAPPPCSTICASNCTAPAPRRAAPRAIAAPAWCWWASSMPRARGGLHPGQQLHAAAAHRWMASRSRRWRA
jgi:5-hydroxyisourate hydrolase